MLARETFWVDHPEITDAVKPRQIFVTRSHFLAKKVKEEFGQLFEQVVLSEDTRREASQSALSSPNLPVKFGELTDEHFPLFITYDQARDRLR